MQMTRGNQAIHDQSEKETRIFLFDMNVPERSTVRFMGEFKRIRTGEDRGPDDGNKDRKRIFFDLCPLEQEPRHPIQPPIPPDNQFLYDEGREREIRTNRVERNRKLVERAKQIHGLTCQVCGFNFESFYGEHGAGFIEVHHKFPVSLAAKMGSRKVDAEADMAVLCPNCHRMIHRGTELLDVDELKNLVEHRGRSH